ncbi:MAG: T9SS type A sorting domain-containing protein [Bacteroidetes bacterium]|nr:T9SS type A sorting domain-containing protein [Bacteroidota bacterium]
MMLWLHPSVPIRLAHGQPVQITGEIHDRFGSVITSFNGPVDITFFNPKTLRMTLGNNISNPSNPSTPQPFMVWDDTLYNATVNVVNGAFSLNFIMPINIDSGFGAGRIAFYANDGVVDAMGCYQNFVLENLTSGIDEYSNVQIQLFPNPSTDKVKCMLNNVVAKDWSYTLTGIDGRKLRSEKIVKQEFFIERNSLASGVYFLKIVDAKGKVVRVEKIVFE